MSLKHIPIMARELCQLFAAHPNPKTYLDLTLGGGGHLSAVLTAFPSLNRLIAIDRDQTAHETAKRALTKAHPELTIQSGLTLEDCLLLPSENSKPSLFLSQHRFSRIDDVDPEDKKADLVVCDLGVSSMQLDDIERGFSYRGGKLPLNFQMGLGGVDVQEWLRKTDETALADTLFAFGGERNSYTIAKKIKAKLSSRLEGPLTCDELSKICEKCDKKNTKKINYRGDYLHPATRTFQALRIVVNDELNELSRALKGIPKWVNSGSLVAFFSFHEHEDRLVKEAFRAWEQDQGLGFSARNKPVVPTKEEIAVNSRSTSAKLRVFHFE